ncbi:VOC family protein [Nostocoides sp. Soil756]|jgi:predicted enzyme related to lactoylglutathione lyase|uniref:VOC family protein n=1 Tax=Nostocoides sp. Soil756 TaxID=1736399 RepID=UPI0006F2EC78|nr:VOC family protein [Tetrasphaera sp. Soil756]KRE62653.1 glyoxalase-like domain protein [Tetrasphaera sp. Soil756]
MYLENVSLDAHDPGRLGRFWQGLLGGETLTDEAELFETRLAVPGGPVLDLCFPAVSEPVAPSPRLHVDVAGGPRQAEVVERALGLGARPLDIGQGDVPWVVLADPEGNPFCVMEERGEYAGAGALAAFPLDSADPARDAAFWAELSGWRPVPGGRLTALQHPSGLGPLLELCPEHAAKDPARKNRLHLDIRLEAGDDDDAVLARVLELGGREWNPGWGDLPWRLATDPSGNELCLLPARRP